MPADLLTKTLPTEADTAALAARMADRLGPGDTLLLKGDIGAGKTCFARALIRHRLGRMEDVPSPTFTLVQTYDADDVQIWHFDLYRLTDPTEALELGLDDALDDAICLIEWPERLGDRLPAGALTLAFRAGPAHHSVTLQGDPAWLDRLDLDHG